MHGRYGTTVEGGSSARGRVFKVNTDGSGYTALKDFTTGSDGSNPHAGLVLAGSTLYGTTYGGGSSDYGVIFRVNTDGSGYAVLKSFTGSDGAWPSGGLLLAGSMLYGATCWGGSSAYGVIFSLGITPPSITTPPLTQTAETGTTPWFWVEVTNTPPRATYQWYFSGSNALAGATNSYLELANVQATQAGAYTVVVTDIYGAVTSAPAILSVIPPVGRRIVPALYLLGEAGSFLHLDYANALGLGAPWLSLTNFTLTRRAQLYLDLPDPLPVQRFYRTWQTNVPSARTVLVPRLATEIPLAGAIGSSVRIDYINEFGPTNAWVTLDTVQLTNTTQLYFDVTAFRQPARLYRLVAVP